MSSIGPTRNREKGIWACAVCDGYCRNFAASGPRRMTCADETCPGHATGGVLTAEIAAADLARMSVGATE